MTKSTNDMNILLERVSGMPLDPATYRRIRERQEKITAELRKQYDEIDIAVAWIREVRDGE